MAAMDVARKTRSPYTNPAEAQTKPRDTIQRIVTNKDSFPAKGTSAPRREGSMPNARVVSKAARSHKYRYNITTERTTALTSTRFAGILASNGRGRRRESTHNAASAHQEACFAKCSSIRWQGGFR